MNGYPPVSVRLWRTRGWQPNPLMRTSDRVQSAVQAFAVLVLVLVIPLAAALGTARFDTLSEQTRQMALEVQPAVAVLASAPRPVAGASQGRYGSAESEAGASWSTGGVVHHHTLVVSAGSRAGDHVPLWVDGNGDQTSPPRAGSTNAALAVGYALAVWLGTSFLALVGVLGLRRALSDRRIRAWEREWQAVGESPGWPVA